MRSKGGASRFGPMLAMGEHRPCSAALGQAWSMLEFGQNSTEVSTQSRTSLAQINRRLVEISQGRSRSAKCLTAAATLRRNRPRFYRFRTMLAIVGASLAERVLSLAGVGPMWPNSAQAWPTSARTWSNSGQGSGQNHAKLGRLPPSFRKDHRATWRTL